VISPGNGAVVLDTMAMSALVNEVRRPDRARRFRSVIGDREIVISVITVHELRYGAIVAEWGEFRRRGLERSLAKVTAVEIDDAVASTCASLRAACRIVGHPLSQKIHDADRWIAATAPHRELVLVSDDTVSENTPGLSLVATR
jgi:predicted nucleic acid-binding protein